MNQYSHLRRVRKVKKFGKKLGRAIIYLAASYLLSLLSFYLYTQLSQVLQPVEKGFLGFAFIGLIAGLIAILVSLFNRRLILTVIISFAIDCLVDSVILYSRMGTQVIQYLPGLLVSMTSVLVSWNFLKIKLWIPKNATQGSKEQFNKKYTLARKLLDNPNKITLDVFKEACEALQGINPKIDRLLKEADHVTRTVSFLNGSDPIGLAVSLIKVKTKKDEEKKDKLLLFVDLLNDIRDEVESVIVKIDTTKAVDSIKHQYMASDTISAAAGMPNVATASLAIVTAASVVAINAADIRLMLPKIRNQQVTSIPVQTEAPIILPTDIPKTPQILTYSAIEKTFFVSAPVEGTTFTANAAGTYRFMITGGAAELTPQKAQPNHPEQWGWQTKLLIYKNRVIAFGPTLSGLGNPLTGWIYTIGDPGLRPTSSEAEQLGRGKFIDISLNKGDYLIFIVDDSDGGFTDNNGGVYLQVQKGIASPQETSAVLTGTGITMESGWAHFWRSFNGPPGPGTTSTIDYSGMAMYVTVHNNGATEDRITGGDSNACNSITFDDMSISGPDGTIPSILIPAKSTVVMDFMKAGRIICNGAKGGLKQGDRVTMNLMFEKFGQVPVWVEIRATPE